MPTRAEGKGLLITRLHQVDGGLHLLRLPAQPQPPLAHAARRVRQLHARARYLRGRRMNSCLGQQAPIAHARLAWHLLQVSWAPLHPYMLEQGSTVLPGLACAAGCMQQEASHLADLGDVVAGFAQHGAHLRAHQEQLARLLPVSAGVRRRQRRPAVLGSHAVAGMLLSAYAILTCLAPRQSPVVLLSLSHNMHAKDSKAIDFGWSVLHIKEQGTAKLGTTVTVRAPAGQGGGGCAAAVAAPEAAACCARQGCRAGRAAARMAPRPAAARRAPA